MRRSSPEEPGIVRRRRGRGFSYHYAGGRPVRDRRVLARIRALAVPPAWRQVWICRDGDAHLQAVGTDAAGRRQYLYHDLWREEQDRIKFDRVTEMAARLPAFRRRLREQLAGEGLERERVLAAAARMLDLGLFRAGGAEYDTFGLATLKNEHVSCTREAVRCHFAAKGGTAHTVEIRDDAVRAVVADLLRTGHDGELLRYRNGSGWKDVGAQDVNDYLREHLGGEVSAKDFRTWHATVLAAAALGGARRPRGRLGRRKAVRRAMEEVAARLGNTPAVTRASYVDPRVILAYERGRTVSPGGDLEPQVIDLLRRTRR
ncbi:DNA topoisomerase IB [Nonomuraea typhae]|uniref:DNA topoisomerase IB n=1 Tax=Nonomuraea typhae TaxID=2603600 RepID=UPI0012FA0794|nr:DNA topoisomerase IB [Nonomuraea typhae]